VQRYRLFLNLPKVGAANAKKSSFLKIGGGLRSVLKEKNPNKFGFFIDLHYLCRQQTI
jgi:hypothetical protein